MRTRATAGAGRDTQVDPDKDTARGLVQMEGYLLWSAELDNAQRQAALFTEQLPWLTTAQREDVERVYRAERVEASRAMLVRIAERVTELRAEYSGRYATLKARCVAVTVAAVGAAAAAGTAAGYLTR